MVKNKSCNRDENNEDDYDDCGVASDDCVYLIIMIYDLKSCRNMSITTS